MLGRLMNKISSGRWIVTVAAAFVFVWMSVSGDMPADDVKMIVGIIVTFYFTKQDQG